MSIPTILLFFVYSYGLGLATTYFVKNSKNVFERNLMRIGIGIGSFIVLGVILNLLKIPMDWKIFLILSLIFPLIVIFKKQYSFLKLKLTKSNLNILIVFVIFLVACNMYIGGSFSYPFLENDDPWSHAAGVKYIALEKDIHDTINYDIPFVDPYPPGYDLWMGMLYQTNNSIYWTLKFFNGLFLALGIVFFYFFAKLFPSYFTHFIWAHSLAIMLFFPAMYSLEKIKKDKNWIYPSAILIASILLAQPSQAIKLGIMIFFYFLVKCIYERKFLKNLFYAQAGGVGLSLLWWGTKAINMLSKRVDVAAKYAIKAGTSLEAAHAGVEAATNIFSKFGFLIKNYFKPEIGTATRAYTFSDFFIAKPYGQINAQVGWGIVISLLVFISLILIFSKYKSFLKKKNSWMGITIVWFIFTFFGTNAMTYNLPIGFITFRFWLLMAIPVALLSSIGLWACISLSKNKIVKILIISIIVLGVLLTAALPKYQHNTSPNWPPGVAWTSAEEIQAYIWMHQNLPKNSKVFTYSRDDKHITGFDMESRFWEEEVVNFRAVMINKIPEEFYLFLKQNNYEYTMISGMSYKYLGKQFGENQTQQAINDLIEFSQSSPNFSSLYQTKGAILLKVN